MKITIHISFYFVEERIVYINRIIDETNTYECTTDIFVHTNKDVHEGMFHAYTNGTIRFIIHDLSDVHPFYLTWKCRDLLRQQRDEYDIFMYIEDDILVPYRSIRYWLRYNEKLIEMKYNLGFVRIETEDDVEYITDLGGKKFDTIIELNDEPYCVNNKNPYCAFWIYNKDEFHRFVQSTYYDLKNIVKYGIREKSAIGLHGLYTKWYTHTLIPMMDNKLCEDCKIYHMPNNYVLDKKSRFATIQFNDAIRPDSRRLPTS